MSHEALAANIILDRYDPTLLTWKEIKEGWGSCADFFFSHELKPWNEDDQDEAVNLSRTFKEEKNQEERERNYSNKRPALSPSQMNSSRSSSGQVKKCAKPSCSNNAFVEPRTGIVHDYCGRTHAEEMLGGNLQKPHGDCHRCNLSGCEKEVYFEEETGRVHDFCCKEHYLEAVRNGEWKKNAPAKKQKTDPSSSTNARCSYPGCQKNCYYDPVNKRLHDYCGRSHAIKRKISEQPTCSICLVIFSRDDTNRGLIERTRCDHSFHRSCLQGWKARNRICPICREQL
jgi:hypothetical protein